MRHILLLPALAAALFAHAQIVIGPADMASAGDTVPYVTTVAADIEPAITGNGITWDFSDLAPGLAGADTMVSVGSTPLLYQFFFNNPLLYPANQADHAVRGQAMELATVQVQDVYEYFKSDGTSHRNVGFGATINGLPASVRRIPVDHVHRFPLQYGDQDTSFSAFEMEVPGIGFLREEQWRYNTVDGWGTLLLPGGASHEVLRVASVLHRRDSVYIEQFGVGFAIDQPETVEHKWIAAGMDLPVLHVTTVAGVPTTARYRPGLATAVNAATLPGGQAGAPGAHLHLVPNPARTVVALHLPDGPHGHVQVIDATGRTVVPPQHIAGRRSIELPVGTLAPGAYVVRFLGANGTRSGRLIVE